MKNHFKYSILITIVLLITTSLVHVQAIPNIGATTQPHPYESNPAGTAYFMVGGPTLAGKGAMIDGDLTSQGDFYLGAPHIIRPDGNSPTYTAWSEKPSGVGFVAWYEDLPGGDGDGTYVYAAATTGTKEASTLEDAPPIGTISSVKVTIVAKRAATATSTERDQIRILMRTTTDLFSGYLIGTDADYTSYATYVFSSATRPQGGSWTWADVNSLQAGVEYYRRGSASTEIRVTQLYVEVFGPTTGFFDFHTFDNTPDTSFSIGFVDVKIKYNVPTALSDDTYNITYSIDGTTWNTLQSGTSGIYDGDALAAIRPWSQVAKPGGGSWDWTNIGNLRIRVGVTQNGGSWDAQKMYIYEVWLSVYPLPLPPSGGTPVAHLAAIPSAIYKIEATQYIFVDIYVTGVVNMTGYSLLLLFNNLTLTPDSVFIYDPFQYVAGTRTPELNDTRGWVLIQQSYRSGIPMFTGSEPVARIYFTVDQWGTSKLDIINSTEFAGYPSGYFPTGVTESKLKGLWWVEGELRDVVIPSQMHDGWVSSPRYLSAVDAYNNPTTVDISWPTVNNTKWHELYPTYSNYWNITSLTDNGDNMLSHSDQIDMLNGTRWRHWFHIDVVTITIHWSNSSTGEYGKAEAVPPVSDIPGDPTYTTWHVIYPAANFSKIITITSWIDSDSGTTFNPSDYFDFTYSDTPDVTHWAHLDYISTDMLISMKPIPPVYVPPAIPEFPLGTETLMALTLMITIIYLWRTRPKKRA